MSFSVILTKARDPNAPSLRHRCCRDPAVKNLGGVSKGNAFVSCCRSRRLTALGDREVDNLPFAHGPGRGVQRAFKECARPFKIAAEAGDPLQQFNYGLKFCTAKALSKTSLRTCVARRASESPASKEHSMRRLNHNATEPGLTYQPEIVKRQGNSGRRFKHGLRSIDLRLLLRDFFPD